MPKSIANSSSLALVAASTILTAAQARASIVDVEVYHSHTYTQDASGLSGADVTVQSVIVTDVKNEFDGGTVTGPDASVASVVDVSSAGYPFDQFNAYLGPQGFGTFTVNLTNSVTNATATASLSYAADHYPDVAPQVSNYAALQHFDPTKDNSIILESGFTPPGDATSASTTFFIYDETTNNRLLQYSESPGTTIFDVPASTASSGEKIDYYFESDIDYTVNNGGVQNDNIYRDITTGEINAAISSAPEPSTWAMMLVGFGALGAVSRMRRGLKTSPAA